jgi:hypothetical protein
MTLEERRLKVGPKKGMFWPITIGLGVLTCVWIGLYANKETHVKVRIQEEPRHVKQSMDTHKRCTGMTFLNKHITFVTKDGGRETKRMDFAVSFFEKTRYLPDGSLIHGGINQQREKASSDDQFYDKLEEELEKDAKRTAEFVLTGLNAQEINNPDLMKANGNKIIRFLNNGWELLCDDESVKMGGKAWLCSGVEFIWIDIKDAESVPENPMVYMVADHGATKQ